jgi:hypothetical protein
MAIETVADLIALLEGYDDDTPIALAIQPSWPFAHTIDAVEQAENGTVYLAEGTQVCYLPDAARQALGW